MPRKLFAAISQIVLGALIVIAPQTFAHVCAVKDMPMACRYTCLLYTSDAADEP